MLYDNYFFTRPPYIPSNCDKPPTIYSILESIVNYGKEDKTKIKDLAKEGRETIFDFDYPLTDNITKEDFECMILNRFLMRRIGFDTVRAFQIQLNVKLNSIMPMYNKMFDLLYEASFIGDTKIREGTNTKDSETSNKLSNTSETTSNITSDKRFSDTPENQLSEVRDGRYVTEYNYDTNNTTSKDEANSEGSGTSKENGSFKETETNVNILDTILKFNNQINNIYDMIFKDLESLFYQLI